MSNVTISVDGSLTFHCFSNLFKVCSSPSLKPSVMSLSSARSTSGAFRKRGVRFRSGMLGTRNWLAPMEASVPMEPTMLLISLQIKLYTSPSVPVPPDTVPGVMDPELIQYKRSFGNSLTMNRALEGLKLSESPTNSPSCQAAPSCSQAERESSKTPGLMVLKFSRPVVDPLMA